MISKFLCVLLLVSFAVATEVVYTLNDLQETAGYEGWNAINNLENKVYHCSEQLIDTLGGLFVKNDPSVVYCLAKKFKDIPKHSAVRVRTNYVTFGELNATELSGEVLIDAHKHHIQFKDLLETPTLEKRVCNKENPSVEFISHSGVVDQVYAHKRDQLTVAFCAYSLNKFANSGLGYHNLQIEFLNITNCHESSFDEVKHELKCSKCEAGFELSSNGKVCIDQTKVMVQSSTVMIIPLLAIILAFLLFLQ